MQSIAQARASFETKGQGKVRRGYSSYSYLYWYCPLTLPLLLCSSPGAELVCCGCLAQSESQAGRSRSRPCLPHECGWAGMWRCHALLALLRLHAPWPCLCIANSLVLCRFVILCDGWPQVKFVIDEAISPSNLCQLYEGWTPWVWLNQRIVYNWTVIDKERERGTGSGRVLLLATHVEQPTCFPWLESEQATKRAAPNASHLPHMLFPLSFHYTSLPAALSTVPPSLPTLSKKL